MPGQRGEPLKRVAQWIVAHLEQLRVGGLRRLRRVDVVAVDAVEVADVAHRVELLAIALIESLGLRQGACVGRPGRQLIGYERLVCGHVLNGANAVLAEGVEREPGSRPRYCEEMRDLSASPIEVGINQVAFVEQQNEQLGRGLYLSRGGRGVGEDAVGLFGSRRRGCR